MIMIMALWEQKQAGGYHVIDRAAKKSDCSSQIHEQQRSPCPALCPQQIPKAAAYNIFLPFPILSSHQQPFEVG